ncbi:Hypothetical protein SRAE_1000210800 [Strongyloides ratti]|uniref:Uncharacterized protein n=1 Tax=Strongyloides ratti TaxID=34506 RepID=A0A090L8N3_STRRB|nr:Hypothetical protein SRAE_1000210800 [Strongyloides ratti]CEF63850.1 Hypothetical protein SRAE_1000210800 [Strongyloides ratti]
MLNCNNYYGYFLIFIMPLLLAFHLILCGNKSKSNSKLKDSDQNSCRFKNDISLSPKGIVKNQISNLRLPVLSKKKENKQKHQKEGDYLVKNRVKNDFFKNPDINDNVHVLKNAPENCGEFQDIQNQDNCSKKNLKNKNEIKCLSIDLTQDDSNVDKTISSYVSLLSTKPYVHRPPKRNKKSVSAISSVSKTVNDLSTRTACQKLENFDICKCKNISKKKCDCKVKKVCEDKKMKAEVEMPLIISLPTRFKTAEAYKIDDKDMKKNKSQEPPIRSDYSFGSTVKETGKNKGKKENKRSYGNTETFPPPTSLQILQHHSNFELDDLTERIRMMGEAPKLEEAIQIRDDDSIIAALKMKQNALTNKDKDYKVANYVCDKSKEITNTQTKQKEYPKPRKITEVYKNEQILRRISQSHNNNN